MKANMKLRALGVAVLAVGTLLTPLLPYATPPARVHRVGVLVPGTPSATWRTYPHFQAFLEGLRQLGYVEGQNLAIEYRSAESQLDRLPALAAELVKLRPDVILVGSCGAPLDAIRHLTSTIPIVVATCTNDFVAAGIVTSLAHPGGNITGLQKLNPELSAKRLELLKEVLPHTSRVAVLWDPDYSDFAADWRALRAAAGTLGVTLLPVQAHGLTEFETAFATVTRERAEALMTFSDAVTFVNGRRLAELATKSRLPVMCPYRETTEAGGLMSYGPSVTAMFGRSTVFIDKIVKGAKPGDLPIEQPTQFELVINLKTAKALGVTIPQSILMRADKVIE